MVMTMHQWNVILIPLKTSAPICTNMTRKLLSIRQWVNLHMQNTIMCVRIAIMAMPPHMEHG